MPAVSIDTTFSRAWATAGLDRATLGWAVVLLFAAGCIGLSGHLPWLASYPETLTLPISDWINLAEDVVVATTKPFFRAIAWLLDHPMSWVRDLLHWLPWPVLMFVAGAVSWRAGGWKLTVFTVLSLGYMLVIGYWEESMNSLSLVAISVPLAVLIGFILGVWAFASRAAERAITPTLDVLQTVPAFAYLLPILILFGFGPVVGLIASVLYSFAPMVRNTLVGLRTVAPDIIDSGLMSGANRRQLFWRVRVPTALRQLLLGINQTTMASLSMVIVASIIGGTSDIGWEVLSTIRKAQFGESLLAGIVIALMAMILDRVTNGLATRQSDEEDRSTWYRRNRFWVFVLAGSVTIAVIGRFVPVLVAYPGNWVVSPAGPMNDFITWFVVNFQPAIKEIKRVFLFYAMLPLKIGLGQTVTPFTWGFAWSGYFTAGSVACLLLAAWAGLRGFGTNAAVAIAVAGSMFLFGVTEISWLAFLAVLLMTSWRLGGIRLAIGVFAGLVFLLVSDAWDKTMLSFWLCGIAVVISFLFGSSLGIWAAHNDHVSRIMRPVNDTLQTMPLFVILIPIVMVFKIGEFTALLAIMAYSYVPAFRYAEHGLKNVPHDVVEAARSMGCTPGQLLWRVKLPLALPNIMLGLNQTIMYAIAMLVIAALVGTNGLGQQVYIGLSKGDVGIGLVAGAGMAIIAMMADRMCQAAQRKLEEGRAA